jgi:hypothetical protein
MESGPKSEITKAVKETIAYRADQLEKRGKKSII